MDTPSNDFWVVLCWDRVTAGPVQGGPPWLFLLPAHAEQYAAQLRQGGIPSQVRGWSAKVTDWNGNTLIRHPAIPAPIMAPAQQAMLSSPSTEAPAAHDASANGVTQPVPSVPPPPTPSLE